VSTDSLETLPKIDPEIEQAVEMIRDRFGTSGLQYAAELIEAEIKRTRAVVERELADISDPSPPMP
jgi:hypothetical protein